MTSSADKDVACDMSTVAFAAASSRIAGQRRVVDVVGGSVADAHVFAGLAEAYRSELRAHCQRIIGSFTESEDLVQEVLLRAWRSRRSCRGRASFRAWLHGIATNVCLDFLRRDRQPAQPRPGDASPAAPAVGGRVGSDPDPLLAAAVAADPTPDEQTITRETIDLLVAAALTHLPPRQRAVLILRDLLGWPAADTASQLDTTTAAVNSALQRARATIRHHLPANRAQWPAHPSRTTASAPHGRTRPLRRALTPWTSLGSDEG